MIVIRTGMNHHYTWWCHVLLQAPETDEFSFVEVPVWKGKSVLSSYDVAYVWIVVVVYHVVCVLLGMVVIYW